MNTKLKEAVDNKINFAKSFYQDTDSQNFTTMFMIESLKDNKKAEIVAVVGDSEVLEDRHNVVFSLGVRAGIEVEQKKLDSIESFFMLSEVWYSEKAADVDINKVISPSKDPNRIEGLMSVGSDKDGNFAINMSNIKRSFDIELGKLNVSFEEKELPESDSPFKSQLLQNFWDGLKLSKIFYKKLPKELSNYFQNTDSEVLCGMIMEKVKELKNNVKNV